MLSSPTGPGRGSNPSPSFLTRGVSRSGSSSGSSGGSSFDQAASDSDFIDRAIDEPCTYEVEGIGGRAIKH